MSENPPERGETRPPVLDYRGPSGTGPDGPRRLLDQQGCMAMIALAIGLVLVWSYLTMPGSSIASEKSNRIKCASNLREIGQAILLYANDHGGAFPSDFGRLLIHGNLNPEIFTCPSSNQDKAIAPTTREVAALLKHPDHCSYVYLAAGLTRAAPADTVIVVERVENHEQEGVNVLTADGNVKWVKKGPDMERLRTAAATSQPVRLKVR